MPDKQENIHFFEELFRRNYPRLCQRVFRITKDLEAAEDIVQEVFISFWNQEQKQQIDTPEAYLYRACINRALNFTGKDKRQTQLRALYQEQQPRAGNSPEQQLEQQELEKQVQQTIESLPPMCRKVFLLSRYEEMSHKEIAEFLNISPNTVDNHIKKALSILRKFLLTLLLILCKIYFTFFG
ncbi:MAG: RNA polymerase sigma-70 factor [Cytophagales bacterium CG18_big_fil_WC_8_21_14_2_50_42_9]|nr:MAG: RNA polymerase sigma-70 factor [Cytophagales bacterium CG18_big_fil_WC_8_21_14_2_50_42_9]